jgi:hypothetical protein
MRMWIWCGEEGRGAESKPASTICSAEEPKAAAAAVAARGKRGREAERD